MTQPIASAPSSDQHSDLPLAGLRVIELHAIGPVPYAGMSLRSLGAEVIRVSPPSDPGLGVGIAPEFDLLNAGKTVQHHDLKSPAGQQAVHELLTGADVLLEGFRPGVLERLGLGPDVLRERHPRLVLGRLSGWGSRGPLSARAGHDINYLALTGVLHAIGPREEPGIPLNLVADFGGGAMHLLLGVMAKLIQRGISGRGGVAETSIEAGTIGLSPLFFGLLAAGRWKLGRARNLLDGGAPFYRVYATSDKQHMAVGALEPKFFRELLGLLGLSDRYDAARQYDAASWPELAGLIATAFATRTRDEWAVAAAQCDCCVSPVLDFIEASRHPHNLANGWYDSEPFPHPRPVIDFS
ncbi:MAG: CaiB/BaiF CoA-transferase family protein [Burkholderiaceae bacterium]